MKKILFVAAVISLLNACSESVYELPNGSAGGTNDGDVHEGAPCNVATDEAFCTSNGYAMQCDNNKWDLLECDKGCKDGSCITEKTCNDGLIRSHCDNERIKVIECVSPSNTQNKWTINTIECSGHCIDTEKLNNTPVNAECVECTDIKDCCGNELNGCVYSSCSNDHKCEVNSTISPTCNDKITFQCDVLDDGTHATTYSLYCGTVPINGQQNISCKNDKICNPDLNQCVECINDGDCEDNHPDRPTCNNGVCEECPPEHDFDPEKNECVERFKCPPEQIIDPDSNECIDKCGMDGVKAYLKQNESAYKEYGITADVLNDACIISYDEDREQTVLSCGKLDDTIEDRDIIFCGTVYLDKFDGFINSIKGRKIFGVHDATITSHEYTQIQKPLFGVVTNSTIFNLKIRNIQFNDIGNDEQAIRGIIEKMEGTEDTPCEIENISIENVSIVSNANSSKPMGGLIGEAHYLSAKGISVDNFRLNVTESQGNVGGLFGYANKVSLSNTNIQNASIYAYKANLSAGDIFKNVGGIAGSGSLHVYGGRIIGLIIHTDMDNVGGLIGESIDFTNINPDKENDNLFIIASNEIKGYDNIGGLIGYLSGNIIINSPENSILTITTESIEGNDNLGGLIGNSHEGLLSLHHIRSTVNTIIGNNYIAGLIGTMDVSNHLEHKGTDVVINDVNNRCDKPMASCIYGHSYVAGFVGSMNINELATASISNINNSFPWSSISAISDAAGFIGQIGVYTGNPGKLTIDKIISNVHAIKGGNRIGGFISNIDFDEAKVDNPLLEISNVTSKTEAYATISITQQLYNAVVRSLSGSSANVIANQPSVNPIDSITASGWIYRIGSPQNATGNWYTDDDVSGLYAEDGMCCGDTRCWWPTGNCSYWEHHSWSDFSPALYEDRFTSKITASNIVIKNNNHVDEMTRTGLNALSGMIGKTEKRECSRDNKDLVNAMNRIYSSNVYYYSIVEPCDGSDNCFDIHSSDVFHYNSPIKYCYYDDFANINIMYDMYCKDVNVAMTCDVVPEDAIIKNDRLVRSSDVPNRMEKGTWHFDKTLGLPVPALQGIVVKQEEPLPLEPIDPDDSREPAPDSPVEP